MPRPFIPLSDRFWQKVQKRSSDECWEWTASRAPNGYGQIGTGGRRGGRSYAHRVSWMLAFGEIPAGIQVLHRCDNPGCVNPHHLFLGTQGDNVRDMWAKGRAVTGFSIWKQPYGEKNSHAKLTASDVVEIRAMAANGDPQETIAAKFHVNRRYVGKIVRGERRIHG